MDKPRAGKLRILKGIIYALMVISLAAALYIGSALTIITSNEFYLSEFQKVGTYDNFGENCTPTQLAESLTTYFRDSSSQPPDISQFDIFESLHLLDVKILILNLRHAFFISAAILTVCLLFMTLFYRKTLSRNLPSLLLFSGIAILLLGLLLSLLALGFTANFIFFHRIFFPQGNWQFPADSTLIKLFPEQFFQDAFMTILYHTCFFGLLLLFLGITLRHARKIQKEL